MTFSEMFARHLPPPLIPPHKGEGDPAGADLGKLLRSGCRGGDKQGARQRSLPLVGRVAKPPDCRRSAERIKCLWMGTGLKKYIAIRYNIAARFKPSQWDGKGRANLDPVWLVERLALFDTYCAPSLESSIAEGFYRPGRVRCRYARELRPDSVQLRGRCRRQADPCRGRRGSQ